MATQRLARITAYPTDANVEWITFYTKPDNIGRRSFSLRWLTDYRPDQPIPAPGQLFPKGQHFFCDPAPHMARLTKLGKQLVIVDEAGNPVTIDHVEAR